MGRTDKSGKGKMVTPSGSITMKALGVAGEQKATRQQLRFERDTKDGVQTLARRGMSAKDLAAAIRRCLNNMHGPEWHCLVGRVKAFNVHVRFWRRKAFLFEGSGLSILIFQSAPLTPMPSPTAGPGGLCEAETDGDEGPTKSKAAERTSIKVLRSEMDQAHQKLVLEMASIAAKSIGKDGDLDSIVIAIKASLTESKGPLWHVVATRGGREWDYSVAFEDEQLLDFKLNGDRILVWKYAQKRPGLGDTISTTRISSFLFMATVLLLCVYVKVQDSCDMCCSSSAHKQERIRCANLNVSGDVTAGEPGLCEGSATDDADRCLRYSTILFYVTCGTLAGATALKWVDRSKQAARKIV